MTEKNNARPDAATSERAENGTAGRNSQTNFTSRAEPRQVRISDYLGIGPKSALTIRDLEHLTGQKSREIRKQIEQERRRGELIISDNQHGYFLTDDPVEAKRFSRSMCHRAREIMRTAVAVESAAESLLLSDLAVQSRIDGV